MIRPPVGRYIRYWYTYRNVVAVLIGLVLSGSMFWLYTQQVACDAHAAGCLVNISVHPEDRFYGYGKPDKQVVIVGIDNQSVRALGQYPLSRSDYADALKNLEKDGAAVVAFDVSFPDPRDGFGQPSTGDSKFAAALSDSKIPVILSYPAGGLDTGAGKLIQQSGQGIDEIPLKAFRCMDEFKSPDLPCQRPDKNVILASPDLQLDADGVVRKVPLFVQPACFADGGCSTPVINNFAFAAYRALNQGADQVGGTGLTASGDRANYGSTWSAQVDGTGSALINFSGPPGNYERNGQYAHFSDVVNGTVSPDLVKGNIVLIGAYNLSGVHDEQLVTTSAGSNGTLPMAGVELHANVIQMFGVSVGASLLTREPPLVVLLSILALAVLLALLVARLSVIRGLLATVVALAAFTVAMAFLAGNYGFVPDLFHPMLAMALTYTGVTAYRVLYEDRERRKVTSLFGQYLKPEIVTQLAKTRGGVADIMRGGERRDITLLFVDIRGFTSMSESMNAHDVAAVIQMYLDHLSGIIFTWDGTIDKYVGDEIVAFWGAPRTQENHALLAVRCAYDLINRAPELQERLLAEGLPPVRWGIGVNTGPAVVGNLGSRSRIQYTALGDTVNTAARFCANAPAFHLLIGQPTYDACKDYIAVDLVPGVQLKGKSAETFRIYQVVAIRETPTSPWVQFPTDMASEAHQGFAQQYTQKSILAAANAESKDILVGAEAEAALAGQAAAIQAPPAQGQ
jgi:adenylate cyclase